MSKAQRGTCPTCSKDVSLSKWGYVREHGSKAGQFDANGARVQCAGVNEKAAPDA